MKIISAVLLILFFLPILYFHPILVFAQTTPPTTYEVITFDATTGPSSLIKIIIEWAFKIAGILAFAMIVFAGFEYTTSGGNTSKQKDAQEKIIGTIIGIILLFSFYIILNTINPDILKSPIQTPNESGTGDEVEATPDESGGGGEAGAIPDETSLDQKPTTSLVDITQYAFPPKLTSELEGYIDLKDYGVFLNEKLADNLSNITKNETYAPFVVTDACVTNTLPCKTTENSRPVGDCHYYGTCVDIDSTTGDNEMLIKIFNDQGLDVLDEGGWLHIALPEATGWGSYQNSCPNEENCCIDVGCWYGAT